MTFSQNYAADDIEEFKSQIKHLVNIKNQSGIDLQAIVGRETVGPGIEQAIITNDEDDLRVVTSHLRKYFTTSKDYYSLSRSFDIWKSKFN